MKFEWSSYFCLSAIHLSIWDIFIDSLPISFFFASTVPDSLNGYNGRYNPKKLQISEKITILISNIILTSTHLLYLTVFTLMPTDMVDKNCMRFEWIRKGEKMPLIFNRLLSKRMRNIIKIHFVEKLYFCLLLTISLGDFIGWTTLPTPGGRRGIQKMTNNFWNFNIITALVPVWINLKSVWNNETLDKDTPSFSKLEDAIQWKFPPI